MGQRRTMDSVAPIAPWQAARLFAIALLVTLSCATCTSSSSSEPAAECPTNGAGYVGTGGYPASALPHGGCNGAPDCALGVAESCEPACPGYGAVSGYLCTCAGGTWSCKVTSQGDGACTCRVGDASPGGPQDAAPPPDASGDGDGD